MSSYKKFLLATQAGNSRRQMESVFDAAADWADPDTEFSILHTVTPVTESRSELKIPLFSQMHNDILDDAEAKICALADEVGIEGKATILATDFNKAIARQQTDRDTLVIVPNGGLQGDLPETNCDILFPRP